MSTIEEIKDAVTHLPESEFSRFRKWFDDYEEKLWNKEIEKDLKAGKLESAKQKALKDFNEGRSKPL